MEPFAWPVAVVVLGISAMLIFRRPLFAFLGRTTSLAVWKGRIEANAGPQPASEAEGADELMKEFDNRLLVAGEQDIHADLTKRGVSGQTAVPVLVRYLAAAQIALHFERVYSAIWGSQLAILQHVNTLGDAGASLEGLRPFYQQAAATFPQMYQTYPFEGYMRFLTGWRLVEVRGDDAFITLAGREFLKWVIDQGKTLYRVG